MKGLLLKDFYMATKYCRSFLLIIVLFLTISCFGNENMFFAVYPALITGMIPVSLISYDEREKWNLYSAALPYTRAQLVSSKYLIGLLFELSIVLLSAVTQVFRVMRAGAFSADEFLPFVLVVFVAGLAGPALLLPFIFRFGSEKGRIAYYLVLGALCAGATILSNGDLQLFERMNLGVPSALVALAAAALYAGSWGLSILIYRKREL